MRATRLIFASATRVGTEGARSRDGTQHGARRDDDEDGRAGRDGPTDDDDAFEREKTRMGIT